MKRFGYSAFLIVAAIAVALWPSHVAQRASGAILDSQGGITHTVTVNAQYGTLVDASGSIATGGTAQTLMAANSYRHKIIIENTSASAVITFSFTGTAGAQGTAGSYVLQPGQFFTSDPDACSTQAISVYSATTGATWTANYM